jgi:hypothetical protein
MDEEVWEDFNYYVVLTIIFTAVIYLQLATYFAMFSNFR